MKAYSFDAAAARDGTAAVLGRTQPEDARPGRDPLSKGSGDTASICEKRGDGSPERTLVFAFFVGSSIHFLQQKQPMPSTEETLTSSYMPPRRSRRLSSVSKGGVKKPFGTYSFLMNQSVRLHPPRI